MDLSLTDTFALNKTPRKNSGCPAALYGLIRGRIRKAIARAAELVASSFAILTDYLAFGLAFRGGPCALIHQGIPTDR